MWPTSARAITVHQNSYLELLIIQQPLVRVFPVRLSFFFFFPTQLLIRWRRLMRPVVNMFLYGYPCVFLPTFLRRVVYGLRHGRVDAGTAHLSWR